MDGRHRDRVRGHARRSLDLHGEQEAVKKTVRAAAHRWCGMRREGFMKVGTFTTMFLPAIAIALAVIILKPMLRDSLFVDPQ